MDAIVPKFVWTDERIKLLTDLWATGLSAQRIMVRLGNGVTRNAVLGKADRLNLTKRRDPSLPRQYHHRHEPPPKRIKPTVAATPKPKLPALRLLPIETEIGHPNSPFERSLIKREARQQPIEPPPQPRGDRPTMLDLKKNDCRWPYGDPRHKDFHFCGQPRVGEGPYCSGHGRLAGAPRSNSLVDDEREFRVSAPKSGA